MKLTLKQIKEVSDLLNSLTNKEFKPTTGYKISKILKLLTPSINTLEEARVKLVLKHGEIDPDTGNSNVKQGNIDEFYKEYNDLCNLEEELELPLIKFEELDSNELKLSPSFFIIMGDIITG